MEKEKKNNLVVILLVIFVMISTLLAGYILYDKFLDKDKQENLNNNPTTNPNENMDTNESEVQENKMVSKINDNKYWVYQANYPKDVKADYYILGTNVYYAKDIKAPYINVNSNYAKEANDEIKKAYDEALQVYNQGVENKTDFVEICDYETFIDNDILSLAYELKFGATAVTNPDYYTYNIDLKTGNKLSYKDIYTKLGFTENTINTKAKEKIKEELDEMYQDAHFDSFDSYYNESVKNYEESVANNTIKYFIDEGELEVVVTIFAPFEMQYFIRTIEID